MYDVVIIGAGMSGLAAGIRLAMFDQPRLHSGTALRHRRAEFVLSPGRPQLRRRPARADQLRAARRQARPTGPPAAAIAYCRGTILNSPSRSARRSYFPACGCDSTTIRHCSHRKSPLHFPSSATNIKRCLASLLDYDQLALADRCRFRRAKLLADTIHDPLLVEMLLCPVMFYGSAQEHDIDWGSFSVLFRAIFLEGLARPRGGIRVILKHLVQTLQATRRRIAAACRRARIVEQRFARAGGSCWTTAPNSPPVKFCRRPAGTKPCGFAQAAADATAERSRPITPSRDK